MLLDVLECALAVQVPLMGAMDAQNDADARAASARVPHASQSNSIVFCFSAITMKTNIICVEGIGR